MTGYLAGLLGEGITRSFTPPMHRREAAELGIDYEYRVLDSSLLGIDAENLPEFFTRVVAEGYTALNVTHPFKQRIVPLLARCSDAATELAAVNLVLFNDGVGEGHNTDWTGFRWAVMNGLADTLRERIVQIGAGGAGAATAYALLDLGVAELSIYDSEEARAIALAERYRARFPGQRITALSKAQLAMALGATEGVVHATPVGMAHSPGMPFDLTALHPDAWVADIVYVPLETELLKRARAAGHRVLDGGLMAVGQAVGSFRLITGLEPDAARMRRHFLELASNPDAIEEGS